MPSVLRTFVCHLIKVANSLTMQRPCCPLVERGHRRLEGLPLTQLSAGKARTHSWVCAPCSLLSRTGSVTPSFPSKKWSTNKYFNWEAFFMQVPGRQETTWGSLCTFSWAGPLLPVTLRPGSREGRGTARFSVTVSAALLPPARTAPHSFSYWTFA